MLQRKSAIRIRQAQGIAEAKARNVKFGRPKVKYPDNWDKVINLWTARQITAKQAMSQLGLKRSTFYNLVKEGGENHDR